MLAMQHLQNLGQAQPAYRALAAARLIEGVGAPWRGRGLVGGTTQRCLFSVAAAGAVSRSSQVCTFLAVAL